jgi:hypothetical protein
VSGGFSKLSKVLNQEDALGAPCLGCDFCSPQAPSRGVGMLRTGVIRRFGVTFTVEITRSSRRHALMLSGGWRQCTGKMLRRKAKQGRREDGADVWILNSIVVRFLGRFRERKESLVTMVALCFHHRAVSPSTSFEYVGDVPCSHDHSGLGNLRSVHPQVEKPVRSNAIKAWISRSR